MVIGAGAATPASAASSAASSVGGAGCDQWGCADDQPLLSTPVPKAAPAGAFARGDFDSDGVLNRADNCLLVPNPGQEPARRPAGATVDPLAAQWKKAHPGAAFRTNAELGEYFTGFPQASMPLPHEQFNCSDGTMVAPFTDGVTAHVWGGKRLFTPTDGGGTITNRP